MLYFKICRVSLSVCVNVRACVLIGEEGNHSASSEISTEVVGESLFRGIKEARCDAPLGIQVILQMSDLIKQQGNDCQLKLHDSCSINIQAVMCHQKHFHIATSRPLWSWYLMSLLSWNLASFKAGWKSFFTQIKEEHCLGRCSACRHSHMPTSMKFAQLCRAGSWENTADVKGKSCKRPRMSQPGHSPSSLCQDSPDISKKQGGWGLRTPFSLGSFRKWIILWLAQVITKVLINQRNSDWFFSAILLRSDFFLKSPVFLSFCSQEGYMVNITLFWLWLQKGARSRFSELLFSQNHKGFFFLFFLLSTLIVKGAFSMKCLLL